MVVTCLFFLHILFKKNNKEKINNKNNALKNRPDYCLVIIVIEVK
jgi:hypothetical protein